jgi:diacylglycerol diphosphate phosphatase/phosphatidate phosphatase
MVRNARTPGEGLAAQSGWIGSVARFWEVGGGIVWDGVVLMNAQKTYAPDYVGLIILVSAYMLVRESTTLDMPV